MEDPADKYGRTCQIGNDTKGGYADTTGFAHVEEVNCGQKLKKIK